MEENERFDLVVFMGEIILYNGGEIFRANETMECAPQRFGVQNFSAFITANGILPLLLWLTDSTLVRSGAFYWYRSPFVGWTR